MRWGLVYSLPKCLLRFSFRNLAYHSFIPVLSLVKVPNPNVRTAAHSFLVSHFYYAKQACTQQHFDWRRMKLLR